VYGFHRRISMNRLGVQRFTIAANIMLAVACVPAAYGQVQISALVQHSVAQKSTVPAELQPALSAAVGRDIPAYHAQPVAEGFEATTAHQRLVVHFNSDGVELRGRNAKWLMQVRGFGYANAMQSVSATAPQANRNRVDYRRGSLTEWYVNGPVGLEQGFTFSEPPRSGSGNLLTIACKLSGNLHAAMESNGDGLSLTAEDGKRVFRYSGLTARDASGKKLPAWLELSGGELLLRTDDTGARYPVVVDPWIQLAELTASDGVNGDQLGVSASISGDTVVAGAEFATVNGNTGQGAAYVFVKAANGWGNMTQTAKLTASDGKAGDGFGGAVFVAGNTIAIGACPQSGVCNGPGKVYVFLKPKSGWTTTSKFKAKLTASDGSANDGFSNELGLSADGKTIVVGAAGAIINGNTGQGAAYVFVKPAAGWKTATQTAKLTELHGHAGDLAGEVSVSGDGSTVFVGAPGAVVGANTGQGVAYLFLRPASGWKATSKYAAKLSAKDGAAYDDFGFCQAGSSCISSDGTTVLVGAPQYNFSTGTGTGPGKAYVFVKPTTGWKTTATFNAELTASDGVTGDALGWSAAITSNSAAVGAVGSNGGAGAVYAYSKPKAGWKTTSKFAAKLVASDGDPGDGFGFIVSISGNTIAVGAPGHPYNGSAGPGAAYVFGP
jgi:trimeric autotransporter adhesin